jgi:thiol-disulfide isomerase/thioredoxin
MKNLILFFVFLFSFPAIAQVDYSKLDSLLNKPVPLFTKLSLNGKIIELQDYKGKTIMINFWSLSCSACFKELPDLNKIVAEMPRDKFVLISLMDNTKEEIEKIISDSATFYKLRKPRFKNDAIDFEIIPDAKDILKEYTSSLTFPLTLFIDEKGILRDYEYGYTMSMEGFPGAVTNYTKLKEKLEVVIK